jgi:hypothetical protein
MPVSACIDGVAAFVTADQCVKAKGGQVHILRPGNVIQRTQDVRDPSRILHAEPAAVSRGEEALKRLVSERADHYDM